MEEKKSIRFTPALAGVIGLALVAAPLAAVPASANTAGTAVVISEVYANGGSANATFTNKYVELYNPTSSAIALTGLSLQYRAATSTAAPGTVTALTGTIPAKGYYLVQGSSNGTNGAALPTPNQTSSLNPAAGGGVFFLANQTSALPVQTPGSVVNNPAIIDLFGFGTANVFETAAAAAGSVTASMGRSTIAATAGLDTDSNQADFVTGTPTPTNANGDVFVPPVVVDPEAPPAQTPVSIASVQGTTDTSPVVNTVVTVRGVVTAAYPTGGINGYYIQTPGTGGALDLGTHTASDGIFIYSPATVAGAVIGDYVEVTGTVKEFSGLTEIEVLKNGRTTVPGTFEPVVAASLAVPTSAAQRESLESMLLLPTGDYTITDNYDTNYYASIGIVAGDEPLKTPTAVVEPGSAEYTALVADNAARLITLDDGATVNYSSAANAGTALPYLSTTNPVRIGAATTFTMPVIMDYRNSLWTLEPTQQLTVANASTVQPATFENTRTESPDDVGGDVTLASFNVLNYFTTVGESITGCSYYTDRAGNRITVNTGCDARGAATTVSLERQQAKIVSAINALGADVVSLEEIENSARFSKPRDTAIAALVDALNAAAGAGTWDYVRSPAALPASEDVIRTGFIYKPAVVSPVGDSVIDDNAAFSNARQPLAQAFELADEDVSAGSQFLAIVNHFKSKGSGTGADADAGDGQGASNASRVAQATELVAFADGLKASTGIERVLLSGDFNAYLKEDPIDVLTEAGYVDLGSTTGKSTYAFDGAVGSLDHIFANTAADAAVTDVDVWNINSVESIALEYSRYNYNVTDFYQPNAYRSSDHDPLVVGLSLAADITDINLLNINDFHGRIDANTTKFAGTIEKLRAAAGEENTLFLSDGDNIGASLFASSSQDDQPTIDVLNALELKASAVGNHEFDKGFDDLTGRVSDEADFSYLGANVYLAGTETPALQEYEIFVVDGVRVAVIGAVTEETPTLVSPGGIQAVTFGDPVEAVNRVAAEIGDDADVIVAEYHEGAGAGTPEGATLEEELAIDSAFTDIVENTSADVDAIFTGHTHKQYVWDAPVPGEEGETRPVLQTGSYGENIGQIELKYNEVSGEVVSYEARNVARTTDSEASLVAAYPRVAEVKQITDAAIAEAAVIGNVEVGTITKDITTAFTSAGVRDDRANESTLGNLVADSIVDALKEPAIGGAEIGVVNPGGLRADLRYAKSGNETVDGVVTYAEANAVLPFVNNLGSTSLTGAQFKTLLEQQWQTDANGNVPSRPFLALGLSKNVNYTYDPTATQGNHVTSITIDGEPIVATDSYRVGTFSFLLEGGDNFRVFTSGTGKQDSGLVDRDAWISYITNNSPLSPAFDRRAVAATGVPTDALVPGTTGTVELSKLDLTSLGSPANTEVSASFAGSEATPTVSTVTAGASTISFVVPTDLGEGAATLVITASPSNTTVRIPVTIGLGTLTKERPVISGSGTIGSTLTAVVQPWGPAPVTLSYQWKANNAVIAGATSPSFTVTKAQAGRNITVTVTGEKTGYESTFFTSVPLSIEKVLTATPTPKMSGTSAKVGTKITAIPGTWSPAPVTLTYQWKRDGRNIIGATSASYTPKTLDVGKKLTVSVTGSKTGYQSVTQNSGARVTKK